MVCNNNNNNNKYLRQEFNMNKPQQIMHLSTASSVSYPVRRDRVVKTASRNVRIGSSHCSLDNNQHVNCSALSHCTLHCSSSSTLASVWNMILRWWWYALHSISICVGSHTLYISVSDRCSLCNSVFHASSWCHGGHSTMRLSSCFVLLGSSHNEYLLYLSCLG